MFDQTIKLKAELATKDANGNVTDWLPAVRAVALELEALNQYVGQMGINPETGEDYFPRPIPANSACTKIEGMLGDNSIPDAYGRMIIRVPFEYLDYSMLPITTFSFVGGKPAATPVIL